MSTIDHLRDLAAWHRDAAIANPIEAAFHHQAARRLDDATRELGGAIEPTLAEFCDKQRTALAGVFRLPRWALEGQRR